MLFLLPRHLPSRWPNATKTVRRLRLADSDAACAIGGRSTTRCALPHGIMQQRRDNVINAHDSLQSKGFAERASLKIGDRRRVNKLSRMKRIQSLEELVQVAYYDVNGMSSRDLSLFWNDVLRLLQKRRSTRVNIQNNLVGHMQQQKTFHQFDAILVRTLADIETFRDTETFTPRDLVTTTLSLAKIVRTIGNHQGSYLSRGSHHETLRGLLIGKNSETKRFIFHHIAWALRPPTLAEIEPRLLSNLIYAYAISECVPEIEDGRSFFDIFAHEVIPILKGFEPQHLSNTVWAFAKVKLINPGLFEEVGDVIASMDSLREFEAQTFSNLLWAYTTLKESHPRLFNKVSHHIVALEYMESYIGQDFTNIVRAYATAGEPHSELFEKIADHIIKFDNLESFGPQHFSNIPWAYATAKESQPALFKKLANHVIEFTVFVKFKPRDISQILWAYATLDELHPELFLKLADHIIAMDSLDVLKPRDLSNIVWAYATVKLSQPKLFKKIADHLVLRESLEQFGPQDISQISWGYATAKESQSQMFQKFADAAITKKNQFNAQDIANFLWSCATNGHIDQNLYSSLLSSVHATISDYNSQEIANIAWSYAVADVAALSLFNDDFIGACLAKKYHFNVENLSQLHQWQLWQYESKTQLRLPQSLRKKCHDAFCSDMPTPSVFQDDVIFELSSIGLQPEEEVLTGSGYRLDAIVEVNGTKMGIEADGPYHFVGRQPNGSTILKRRQVANLDEIPVVSVPYWDWYELGKDSGKKQHYLRSVIGLR